MCNTVDIDTISHFVKQFFKWWFVLLDYYFLNEQIHAMIKHEHAHKLGIQFFFLQASIWKNGIFHN